MQIFTFPHLLITGKTASQIYISLDSILGKWSERTRVHNSNLNREHPEKAPLSPTRAEMSMSSLRNKEAMESHGFQIPDYNMTLFIPSLIVTEYKRTLSTNFKYTRLSAWSRIRWLHPLHWENTSIKRVPRAGD